MKIRRISFSNINNLKGGPHVVDFTAEPLESAGIFAIVGPTGSGKSTILDVISLALFNEVPRHGKLSKKSIQDAGSIVTHNALGASATVEYEVKNQLYASTWSIESTKKGNLKDYDMKISDSAGNFLDLRRSEVPAKNAELIGLNYDQFVKSIILSQGDFSRFLKAKAQDRSELLEKLTGSQIYRKLSIAAFNRNKTVSQSLDLEKTLLSEIHLLSAEEVKEIEDSIKESKKQSIQLEISIKHYNEIRSIKRTIVDTTSKITKIEGAVASNTSAIRSFEKNEHLLLMHSKVAAYKEDLLLFNQASNNKKKAQAEIVRYESDLNSVRLNFDSTIRALSTLINRPVAEGEFLASLRDYQNSVLKLDYELETLKVKGNEGRAEVNRLINTKSFDLDAKVQPEVALQQLTTQKSTWTDIIKRGTGSLAESMALLKKDQGNLRVLQDVKMLVEKLLQDTESARRIDLSIKKYQQLELVKGPSVKQQSELITALRSKSELLLQQKEDALKIAKLETFRAQLTDGEPCPLCGSKEHPFSLHLEQMKSSEIESAIRQNENLISEKEVLLRSSRHELSEAQTSIKIGLQRLSELDETIASTENKIELEKNKYTGRKNFANNEVANVISELTEEISRKERRVATIEKLNVVEELLLSFRSLAATGAQYKKKYKERGELYSGADIKLESKRLQEDFTDFRTKKEQLTALIANQQKELNAYKEVFASQEQKLLSALPALNISKIEEMRNHLLGASEHEELLNRKSELNETRIKLAAELAHLVKEQAELVTRDKLAQHSLVELVDEIKAKEKLRDEVNALLGEKSSQLKIDAESRNAQAKRRGRILQLEKESEKWGLLNKMIGSSKGDSFANFAQELTLKNLMALANRRLVDLSERYRLGMPKNGGPLEIIDIYQGQTERSVNTLSGGEVFILSLALALSLSDMASQNIALESLFIDEGFGTLDHETLDVAMTTLEKLQSESKKMVGIISHVEALKERIHVQIQLQKNAQGYSKIRVVS